jgi:hypothetical protein
MKFLVYGMLLACVIPTLSEAHAGDPADHR